MLTLEHLADLAAGHPAALRARVAEFEVKGRRLAFNERPALMGVVNLSPDSWYRESVVLSAEAAVERALVLAAQGADIIDLGAESTLAHAARAGTELQSSRLLPVVRELAGRGIPVSVETYTPAVARACLEAGAAVLNLTGTDPTEEMFRLAAAHEAAVILCHVQGEHVRAVGDFEFGADPVAGMQDFFARQIGRATRCGVTRLLVDPGLGFYYRNLQDSAVRVRHQMRVFLNTFRLRTLGWPVCHALPHAFEFFGEEVRSAEPFFAVLAALGRTDLFRTHEVPRTRAVLRTLGAFAEPAR
ncbi:MAG TPA: dihydropteroate synthase [Verrucomicrobiota bacterium]|nr:dihydropteroate synthase [Verrucomicrobiota bacterium]